MFVVHVPTGNIQKLNTTLIYGIIQQQQVTNKD